MNSCHLNNGFTNNINNVKEECIISKEKADKFAGFLNATSLEYETSIYDRAYFNKDDCGFYRFFIQDITDSIITNSIELDFFDIKNEHVYLFYSLHPARTFCNVAYVRKDDIVFFEAINCKERETNLEEVLFFFEDKLLLPQKNKVIERIKYHNEYIYYNNEGIKLDCELVSVQSR